MAKSQDGPSGAEEQPSATTDLRRRRAEVSKQAIRDAVGSLLLNDHPASLSIPAVAAEAGVSVRTVYRYFPTKQDLLDDVAEVHQRRADKLLNGRQNMFDAPADYVLALWTDFEQDLEAVKAQHLSPLGAEVRAARLKEFRADVRLRLDKAFPDTPQQSRDELGDLIIMVMSSSTFLDLHSRLGYSAADAARMAWWAVRAMQKQFAADGGFALRPTTTEQPKGST